jgi:hypothetical protein
MQIRTYECVTCNIVQTDLTPLQTLGSRMRKPDLLANCGFDDESTSLLGAAFDDAWQRLKDSDSPLAAEPLAASTRESLAKCIVVLGRRADIDSTALVERALALLAKQKPIALNSADKNVIAMNWSRGAKHPHP